MIDKKFPKPEDIQKEFEDFVQQKFGGHVQVISPGFTNNSQPPSGAHSEEAKTESSQPSKTEPNFDLKPKSVASHLDRFVIGQDEAKKALAIAVCDHYNQVLGNGPQGSNREDNYAKQNVLVLGPTGVGKTYMIKQIAKLVGVPFVKADATRFSETGYMGSNVDDLIKDLVNQADGDIERAQFGIVYLDEADKLASSSQNNGRDVSGRGVQLGLLKLMEETDVDLRSGHDPASQMQAFLDMQQKGKVEKQIVNTKHILFIVSGAFTGIEKIIAKRLNSTAIGFNSPKQQQEQGLENLHEATTQDFIDYGFEPEFVGRLPVRVACRPLDEDKLLSILKNSEGSIIHQYQHSFASYGIEATFSDEALKAIARLAAKEQTGARSLMTICERIFRDYKYELPSSTITSFTVTEDTILSPSQTLKHLLAKANEETTLDCTAIREFEAEFEIKHKMKIYFNLEACKLATNLASSREVEVKNLLEDTLYNYEHGLKLIQQNTRQESFELGEKVVSEPKAELERMVKDSYNFGK